jgi:hypothetical protein
MALSVSELERWAQFGGHWNVIDLSEDEATVELRACTGEPVERRHSNDPALIDYLRTRRHR